LYHAFICGDTLAEGGYSPCTYTAINQPNFLF
jgi:hypothetical protein